MSVDQLGNEHEERDVNLAFLALALQRVEASDPGPLKDRTLQLFAELAEWVRRGVDLNDLDAMYEVLSLDSRETFQAAFGSMATQPDAFAASLDTSDQMLERAQRHVTWKVHRNPPA